MTGGALLLLMLLVSWTSLILQSAVLIHLWRQRASCATEKLVGRRLMETAACRVLAAAIYVTVAVLDAAGVRIPGAGMLGAESLVVLTAVQGIWLYNSARDIHVRHQLKQRDTERG